MAWLLASSWLPVACRTGLPGEPPPAIDRVATIESLAVPGFGPAVVSVPGGSLGPKPVLVVAHGAGDRPEWHCEMWQRIVRDRGFVLCVRGRRVDDRVPFDDAAFYYPDHRWLGRVVAAAVQALRASYEPRVDLHGAVYAGYSQGAIMGALVLAEQSHEFARALLIEGGAGEWSVARARSYRRHGGARVLFMCGTIGCRRQAGAATRWLERASLVASVEYVTEGGHTYGGGMEAALPRAFDGLVAGDPRWR
jgi:predicted esterase